MLNQKLTDGFVERLVSSGRDQTVWDAALPRFGLRITPRGRKIYVVQYRAKPAPGVPSTTRKVTIGEHGGALWNVTKARAHARKLLGAADAGGDPVAERLAKAEADARAKAEAAAEAIRLAAEAEALALERFELVAERYIARALVGKRSANEVARLLRKGPVAAWTGRPIRSIRRAQVAGLLDDIRQRTPATARLTHAALRGLFIWCIERDLVETSPVAHVRAPPRPPARDRVLSDVEIRAVWTSSDSLGFPFGPIFKLLILTGQREGEVAGMAWSELDLDAGTWTLPKERTKNGRRHLVHPSAEAIEIIESVPNAGAFLFAARRAPRRKHNEGKAVVVTKPVVGFSAVKRILDGDVQRKKKPLLPTASLAPWRIHDLRRTAATGMARLRFSPYVVERVLNHASAIPALIVTYQREDYLEERKAALAAWGMQVAAIVSGEALPSNVRPLRA
ncbi:MAG: tyrosine-type recombinase/integrase [Pseudomonadota bacterium]|jgi:integrase